MYVHTGELLGQPSSKSASPQLPDWARLYLKSVRAQSANNPKNWEWLFETLTFHPYPLISDYQLAKMLDKLLSANSSSLDMFLSELKRIRDARLFQYPSYSKRHETHRKLWQDVLIGFSQFKPKDLETILMEWKLQPPEILPSGGGATFRGSSLWKLGKRFVQDKLRKALSTRVTESAGYMQNAIFIQLGLDLQRMADMHYNQDADFKKKVDKAKGKRP